MSASRFGFRPLGRASLRHDVLTALRAAILSGALQAGERLHEADLAAEMGISRGPIREALRQLEQEGLVENFPHRGTFVTEVPEAEIDAIYEMRALLETRAVRTAMARGLPAQVPELRRLLAAMQEAERTRDAAEMAELDVQFHQFIMQASGLRSLERLWRSIDGLVRARIFRQIQARPQILAYTPVSHEPIVAAIAAGDVEGAAAALRQHIVEVKDLLLRDLP